MLLPSARQFSGSDDQPHSNAAGTAVTLYSNDTELVN